MTLRLGFMTQFVMANEQSVAMSPLPEPLNLQQALALAAVILVLNALLTLLYVRVSRRYDIDL